jgi:hypothetical protein
MKDNKMCHSGFQNQMMMPQAMTHPQMMVGRQPIQNMFFSKKTYK